MLYPPQSSPTYTAYCQTLRNPLLNIQTTVTPFIPSLPIQLPLTLYAILFFWFIPSLIFSCTYCLLLLYILHNSLLLLKEYTLQHPFLHLIPSAIPSVMSPVHTSCCHTFQYSCPAHTSNCLLPFPVVLLKILSIVIPFTTFLPHRKF